jgi:hypothetical protein
MLSDTFTAGCIPPPDPNQILPSRASNIAKKSILSQYLREPILLVRLVNDFPSYRKTPPHDAANKMVPLLLFFILRTIA